MDTTSPLSTTSTSPLSSYRSSKRSSRIEKPRSIHSSPTGLERRKTTSAGKRYVTLEDRWNMMFGSGDEEMQDSSTTSGFSSSNRPVSWHPSSSNYFNSSPANDLDAGYGFPDGTSAYPSPASGYASTSALAYLSALAQRKREAFPLATLDNDTSMDTSPFPDYHEPSAQITSFPEMASVASQQDWMSTDAPTSHPQTQSEDQEADADCMEDESPKESGNVLVGMGLYDPPSYESMLTSGLGKGLKLEETWQPPPETEDDDAEDDDDDSSDEESVEEAPEPPKAVEEADDRQCWTLQAAAQVMPAADLSGQSFLLEDEETYTNEWWYQQLKRPTAPVAGLGYGWLQAQY
ncbi:hypothetical protein BFW01_g10529 [Lasiodiplodia theobromae]|uniref:Uncharacterized protein n=1 Tax=Lasiodiplodia theobromae TaxID=45133 RepID=A0A5N5D6G7_9PEZI|nr:Membrane protein [Lasiodiplodia theobromae]KAB2573207.1 hypothetical protein DBV05_g8146 [Lasiodiplodia theobromae]KAF4543899.1 Membrane protein [Lasiodiplodia theobromae]KAF9629326.1 hypothetical protein BFW01_g10529 [Lasiodiplodia theobromae]